MKPKSNFQKVILSLFFFSMIPFLGLSQNEDSNISNIENKKAKRPAYLGIAFGVNNSSFRDFATSPLFYSGSPAYISISHIDMDAQRESTFRFSFSAGNYISKFNSHGAVSTVRTFALNYQELFELPSISSDKINVKVGGQINSTFNIRRNARLLNNSTGIELIANLFGSIQTTIDVSRKRDKNFKFLFSNFKLKKRKRMLGFKLDAGIVNSSFRNGFIYTSHAAITNNDNFYEGYQFHIFSGYRINSNLNYTTWLQNGNALRFSYLWDVFSTGHNPDAFEMVQHIFKLSFLYNIK